MHTSAVVPSPARVGLTLRHRSPHPPAVSGARQQQQQRASIAARYRIGQYNSDEAGPVDYDVKKHASEVLTGLVFSPTAELSKALPALERHTQPGPSSVPAHSTGRMDYATKLEVAFNEQINIELNMSYLYLAASAYFARDNVGLPGFAAYYKKESDAEREHAVRLMTYQTQRGGRVVLAMLASPQTEFEHESLGDALYAAEIALSLEKLNFAKLRQLHAFADEADDGDATHYIEDNLLGEQSQDVKEGAVLVAQLQRAGKGLGVFTIDYALQRKFGVSGEGQDGAGFAISPLL